MRRAIWILALCACIGFASAEPLPAPILQWGFDSPEITEPTLVHPLSTGTTGAGSHLVPGKMPDRKALAALGTGKDRGNVGGAYVQKIQVDFTKPFSAEILLKLNADAGYRDFKDIIGFCDGERGPGFRLSIFYNKLLLRTGDGKNLTDIASNPAICGLNPDTWQLVTLTYDGKMGFIYLDGIEVAHGPFQITACKCTALSIGSFRNGYAYPLQGAIDFVKLYNRALESEEVAELYLNEFEE